MRYTNRHFTYFLLTYLLNILLLLLLLLLLPLLLLLRPPPPPPPIGQALTGLRKKNLWELLLQDFLHAGRPSCRPTNSVNGSLASAGTPALLVSHLYPQQDVIGRMQGRRS